MVVLLPTNFISFRSKYEVLRLGSWPPKLRIDCWLATDHLTTESVTQRSKNDRLFNIGVAPTMSDSQCTDAAEQCREISHD